MSPNLSARLEAVAFAQHEAWISSTRGKDLPHVDEANAKRSSAMRTWTQEQRAVREKARKVAYNAEVRRVSHEAINAYLRGDLDAARVAIAKLTRSQVERVRSTVVRYGGRWP
jgi:hypothetical protein